MYEVLSRRVPIVSAEGVWRGAGMSVRRQVQTNFTLPTLLVIGGEKELADYGPAPQADRSKRNFTDNPELKRVRDLEQGL